MNSIVDYKSKASAFKQAKIESVCMDSNATTIRKDFSWDNQTPSYQPSVLYTPPTPTPTKLIGTRITSVPVTPSSLNRSRKGSAFSVVAKRNMIEDPFKGISKGISTLVAVSTCQPSNPVSAPTAGSISVSPTILSLQSDSPQPVICTQTDQSPERCKKIISETIQVLKMKLQPDFAQEEIVTSLTLIVEQVKSELSVSKPNSESESSDEDAVTPGEDSNMEESLDSDSMENLEQSSDSPSPLKRSKRIAARAGKSIDNRQSKKRKLSPEFESNQPAKVARTEEIPLESKPTVGNEKSSVSIKKDGDTQEKMKQEVPGTIGKEKIDEVMTDEDIEEEIVEVPKQEKLNNSKSDETEDEMTKEYNTQSDEEEEKIIKKEKQENESKNNMETMLFKVKTKVPEIPNYPCLKNTCTSSVPLSDMEVWSGDRSVFETLFLALADLESGVYWCSKATFVIDWEIFGPWVRRGNVAPRNDSIRRRLQNYHFRTVKRLPGPDVQEWEHTEGFILGSHCDFESAQIFLDSAGKKKVVGNMRRRKGAPETRKRKRSSQGRKTKKVLM